VGVTRTFGLAAALLLLLEIPLGAQQVSEQRVRAAIDDASRGLGQVVGGGSALTGPAATTGGLGHFMLGASVSATGVEVEDPRRPQGNVDVILPVGTIYGALGITEGGPSGLGAIDLFGRAGPVVAREEYGDNRMLYALGARIALLREGALAPSLSATLSRTWLDQLEYGDLNGDEVSFQADVHVTSARLEVSKGFLLATPYAGVGLHRAGIEADYRIPATRSTGNSEITGSVDSSDAHSVTYGGVEFALALVTTSVEVGFYDGGAFAAIGIHAGF
jgi:hypothetical protein